MFIVTWLGWWYGRGWQDAACSWRTRLQRLYLDFSVPILLSTLFAPWRRITSSSNGTFDQKLKAMVDNTVSRFVGLFVRFLTLIAAVIALSLAAVLGGALVIVWPLIPVAGVILIIVGLVI